ncbi:hypothetical protein SL1157_1846 [Ruegeria lacuscaerulensis ITI-1157]|nr:hypothetical protein SL1157_1846 [Ruegeria lacuscaerulensis ITI-1157]
MRIQGFSGQRGPGAQTERQAEAEKNIKNQYLELRQLGSSRPLTLRRAPLSNCAKTVRGNRP